MRYLLILLIITACTLKQDEAAQIQPIPSRVSISLTVTPPPADDDYTPFPADVVETLQEIYARGQELGNDPHSLSKVGDSITVSSSFLTPIDYGHYDLGNATHLQRVIDQFIGSFAVDSYAADTGWAAWGVLNSGFSPAGCYDVPLVCEYQTRRPIIAVILYGTNDSGYRTLAQYQADLERIVSISMDMGIIPLLTTIPNRPEMPDQIAAFNAVVYDVAEANNLPVIDFYAESLPLPRQGLSVDNLHPSSPDGGWENAVRFIPPYIEAGYTVRNWITLEMLYWVLAAVE